MGRNPTVTVRSPVRVDIAGGTLDIYPVYNLLGSSLTLNFAVNLTTRVEVREKQGSGVRVCPGGETPREFENSHAIDSRGSLAVVGSVLSYFPPADRFTLSFESNVPPGSGLGASSSLIVSLLTALGIFLKKPLSPGNIPQVASEIESSVIHMLTGRQDYIPAIFGGLNVIRFSPGKTQLVHIERDRAECRFLEKYGFLAYTGQAHISGRENWNLVKNFIEGGKKWREGFEKLYEIAEKALEALTKKDPEALGEALLEDWKVRKSLSRTVSFKKFNEFASSPEAKKTFTGLRLCGAGGGGTLFGLLRDPSRREQAEKLASKAGFTPMKFSISPGLEARVGGKKVALL
ncbi:MAG: hypothetical protein D6713_07635 [Deltaproteobacteria bacterium]|nr:MAG: hypothetical protein D6713_07635 [Deltaproteobacteria bacterium]